MQKIKNLFHLHKAFLANALYLNPSKGMKIIGVTGTDGKTTTASLIYHTLIHSGKKAAMLTTVSALIDGKEYETGSHVTTPSPFSLQKYLRKARKAGVTHFVLETTSHSLDQHRVYGIKYTISVLTNITREHLDYHKTYEKYLKAKARLFLKSKISVLNFDDSSYAPLTAYLKKKKYKGKIITYGKDKSARYNRKNFPFETKLIGEFNIYNSLAAIAVCDKLGIDRKVIQSAMKSFTPPKGRQETVYNKDFKILVDFAHTPNSFESILNPLSEETKGRLIHVFGCAGERDAGKRSEMGKISATYADIMILTAEDPRKESLDQINKQITQEISSSDFRKGKEGEALSQNEKYIIEIPRRERAIAYAISIAKKGDIIVCTGKSHEKGINYGKGDEPWDEYEAIKKGLEEKK